MTDIIETVSRAIYRARLVARGIYLKDAARMEEAVERCWPLVEGEALAAIAVLAADEADVQRIVDGLVVRAKPETVHLTQSQQRAMQALAKSFRMYSKGYRLTAMLLANGLIETEDLDEAGYPILTDLGRAVVALARAEVRPRCQ